MSLEFAAEYVEILGFWLYLSSGEELKAKAPPVGPSMLGK